MGQNLVSILLGTIYFCSWVTAWVNRSSTPRKADRLPMENFNSGKEKIDTALVQTLPEKQAIKTVPLTESKGAAQARWMTPPRSNGALSVLNHPIAKADTAQREPPSMPTILYRFLPRSAMTFARPVRSCTLTPPLSCNKIFYSKH